MDSQNKKNMVFVWILIALIGLGVVGYVLRENVPNTPQEQPNAIKTPEPIPSTVPSVSAISEDSTTTATFTGYYTTRKTHNEDGVAPIECPILVVSKSDNPLFVYFSDMAKQGNTVNSLDVNGNLLLNINLDATAPDIKKKVMASIKSYPMTLQVQKRPLLGKDASPCTTFVDILSVE